MTATFCVLPNRGLLRITGPDRTSFLQGLITNDITKASNAIYSCLLTPQGRFLHDFFILASQDSLLMETEGAGREQELFQHLSLYKLRSAVELKKEENFLVLALNPAATAQLLEVAHLLEKTLEGGGLFFLDPRLPDLGARVLISAHDLETFKARFTWQEENFEEYEKRRLRLGVPSGSQDLIPGKSIPLEYNLDYLNAFDWKKGCYMGQELMARTKHRGLIRKRTLPVTLKNPIPPLAPLFYQGKEAGMMLSSVDFYGLALIRLEALNENPKLSLDDNQGNTLHVHLPPGFLKKRYLFLLNILFC